MRRLIEKPRPEERDEAIRYLWAAKFNLPPNDERCLRATAREALEHINGMIAIEQIRADHSKRRDSAAEVERAQLEAMGLSPQARIETKTGADARAIADKPHLTGDPEWDALELAETDPTRPPLQIAH